MQTFIRLSKNIFLMQTFIRQSKNIFLVQTFIRQSRNIFLVQTFIRQSKNIFFPQTFIRQSKNIFLVQTFIRQSKNIFFTQTFLMLTSLSRTAFEWVNPAVANLVMVTCSEGRSLPYGKVEDILSRDASALNCHTNDDKRAWYAIDLGLSLLPTAYTLRHARGYGRSAIRNWLFQVKKKNNN